MAMFLFPPILLPKINLIEGHSNKTMTMTSAKKIVKMLLAYLAYV